MPEIVTGVTFDTVAREWRCKWSKEDSLSSLAKAQELLVYTKPDIEALAGVKEVKRVVCGGCLDFKVIIALDAESFGAWEGKAFAPEAAFLEALGKIPGITQVETQTYTFMTA